MSAPVLHADLPSTGWRDITGLAQHPVQRLLVRRDGPLVTLSAYGLTVTAGTRTLVSVLALPGVRPPSELVAQGVVILDDAGGTILGKLQANAGGSIEWKCPATSTSKAYGYMQWVCTSPMLAPGGWPGVAYP